MKAAVVNVFGTPRAIAAQLAAADAIRIVLVDDHALVRGGVRRLLEEVDGFAIVGEADTAEGALEVCRTERPDAVVMDVGLGDRSGLEILPELIALGARVVMLSMQAQAAYVELAFRRGARAYVLKDAADVELIPAVRAAMKDEGAPIPGVVA